MVRARWAHLFGAALVLVVVLVAAACGGGGDDDAGDGGESDETTETSAVAGTAPSSDAGFTFGNELVLTEAGPKDKVLVANVQLDIVVRNETSEPKTLRFTNGALDDGRVEVGPIPPGAEERWRATTLVSRKWELVGDPSYNGTLATDPGTFGDPHVADTES